MYSTSVYSSWLRAKKKKKPPFITTSQSGFSSVSTISVHIPIVHTLYSYKSLLKSTEQPGESSYLRLLSENKDRLV